MKNCCLTQLWGASVAPLPGSCSLGRMQSPEAGHCFHASDFSWYFQQSLCFSHSWLTIWLFWQDYDIGANGYLLVLTCYRSYVDAEDFWEKFRSWKWDKNKTRDDRLFLMPVCSRAGRRQRTQCVSQSSPIYLKICLWEHVCSLFSYVLRNSTVLCVFLMWQYFFNS